MLRGMPGAVVVIPTYNEAENVVRLVPEVLEHLPDAEVLIVDDDSPDGTADLVAGMGARDPRVRLLRHGPKIGIGPAYKAGFEEALGRRPEYVIQMDADFSHPPGMLPEFVRLAAEHDLVLGSRYVNGITVVNWPIERLLLSYFGNLYVRRILSLPVRDATGGFKCWRREALERVAVGRVRSNGYAFQIETTYRAWKRGCDIHEVPILFLDRTTGDSKMTRRIGMEALWIVWWLRTQAALGRL
jgi:dolichol-phosphate mannosyltransferase